MKKFILPILFLYLNAFASPNLKCELLQGQTPYSLKIVQKLNAKTKSKTSEPLLLNGAFPNGEVTYSVRLDLESGSPNTFSVSIKDALSGKSNTTTKDFNVTPGETAAGGSIVTKIIAEELPALITRASEEEFLINCIASDEKNSGLSLPY